MSRRRAFTLAEVVIVIIIIGVLAAFSATAILSSIEKSKSAEARINIGSITKAEVGLKLDSGSYASANSTQQINANLGINIAPKYYEYKVVGVTDDNFIVIATRIGADLSRYLAEGILPPDALLVAADKNGILTSGLQDYLGSSSGGSSGGSSSGVGSNWGSTGGGSTGGGSSGGSSGSGTVTGNSTGAGSGAGSGIYETITQPADYNSTIDGALSLLVNQTTELRNSRTIDYYYDLIQDKNITVTYVNFTAYGLPSNVLALWLPSWWFELYPDDSLTLSVNGIYVNEYLKTTVPESAVASIIIHEATHADYTYNTEDWVEDTLERHTDITRDDLAWDTNPVTSEQVLLDSHDQELNAFSDEVLTWKAIKGTDTDDETDFVEYLYDQGEDELLAAIQANYVGYPPYEKGLR